MGELMDQIASGGPPLIPLAEIPGAQALAEALGREPERWRFRLGAFGLMDAMRASVIAHAVDEYTLTRFGDFQLFVQTGRDTDGHTYDPEDAARFLLVWCGHGPALFPPPPHLGATFAAYVRKTAAWERSLPPDKTWWQGGPWQMLDGLLASATVATVLGEAR